MRHKDLPDPSGAGGRRLPSGWRSRGLGSSWRPTSAAGGRAGDRGGSGTGLCAVVGLGCECCCDCRQVQAPGGSPGGSLGLPQGSWDLTRGRGKAHTWEGHNRCLASTGGPSKDPPVAQLIRCRTADGRASAVPAQPPILYILSILYIQYIEHTLYIYIERDIIYCIYIIY